MVEDFDTREKTHTTDAVWPDVGRHAAAMVAVGMLVGIALMMNRWYPEGWRTATMILMLAGVGVWVFGALAMRLSAERAPLLAILSPALLFLVAMAGLMVLAQHDVPEGIEKLNAPEREEAPNG